MRRTSRAILALALPLLAAPFSPLAAQDKPTTFTTDLGFVNAAGNTSVTSFNLGEVLTHVRGAWKLEQRFAALYGRTDGEKSAEQFRAGLRGDYAVSERVGFYGLAGWDRNEFAGISRRFEEGAGLAVKAVAEARTTLDVEAGLGATQQRSTAGLSTSFLSGRAAARLKQMLAETAYLQQAVEFLPNFEEGDDYRILSETSLVAPLSAAIALKASYVIRFDNLPEPGFKKTDRVLTTGVQVNW